MLENTWVVPPLHMNSFKKYLDKKYRCMFFLLDYVMVILIAKAQGWPCLDAIPLNVSLSATIGYSYNTSNKVNYVASKKSITITHCPSKAKQMN